MSDKKHAVKHLYSPSSFVSRHLTDCDNSQIVSFLNCIAEVTRSYQCLTAVIHTCMRF